MTGFDRALYDDVFAQGRDLGRFEHWLASLPADAIGTQSRLIRQDNYGAAKEMAEGLGFKVEKDFTSLTGCVTVRLKAGNP